MAYTTRQLDFTFMERIKIIENKLSIEVGHTGLCNKILGLGGTAKTIQDAQKIVEAGFEYEYDFDEAKLFRKRK